MPIYTGNKSTATYVQSNFGGTVGDTTDIGTWSIDNGAHSMRVSVVAAISGYSVCKNYEISVQFNQTGASFQRVLPVSASGSYSNNDFELEAQVNSATLVLRLIKTGGTIAGNYQVTVDYYGYGLPGYSFTEATSTGSGVTPATNILTGTGVQTTGQGEVVSTSKHKPGFYVRGLSNPNTSGYANNLPAVLVFSNQQYDNMGNYSTSTGLFTVPVAGLYFFSFHILADDSAGTDEVTRAELRKNGTSQFIIAYTQEEGTSDARYSDHMSASGVVQCSVGDTIEVFGTNGKIHVGSETGFTGFLIG